jgi:hypothetical protein
VINHKKVNAIYRYQVLYDNEPYRRLNASKEIPHKLLDEYWKKSLTMLNLSVTRLKVRFYLKYPEIFLNIIIKIERA